MIQTNTPIIVALDFPRLEQALAMADRLDPELCRVKVGKELFTAAGPATVTALRKRGFEVFLDLKYHDIPNTVANACRAAADLDCWMVNVHASGGRAMLEAASDAYAKLSHSPLLIAVTVLTSLDAGALKEVGIPDSPAIEVGRLAALTESCGLDGVVCSPLEIDIVRKNTAADFKMVTPGVRPIGAASGDQKRIATPQDALAAGATFLVIGRPVTKADDPADALRTIVEQCRGMNALI